MFNVPDLRGRTIYGELGTASGGSDRSELATAMGSAIGDDKFAENQLPDHHHDMNHTHQFLVWDDNDFVEAFDYGLRGADINTDDNHPLGDNAHQEGWVAVGSDGLERRGENAWTGPLEKPFSNHDAFTLDNCGVKKNTTGISGESGSYAPPMLIMNFLIKH